jgi:hypothetical protein
MLRAGATSVAFTVPVHGDRRREADERFTLAVLADARFRSTDPFATGMIVNDD